MGTILDDKRLINDNAESFSKKIESQYSAFLDKTPTFCDYFHVNVEQSMKDTGLLNVEKLTGKNAATRYNLIRDFPIYGIEQIVLNLEDNENKGYQTEFEGEGIILPNTVQPIVDDHFMIELLGKKYLFRVTEFSYDTIRSNNFYKITFAIKAADEQFYYDDFMSHVVERYRAIFRNYGTEDKFIITEEEFWNIEKVMKVYQEVSEKYLLVFHNKKYNCLLARSPINYGVVYDVFTNFFCNDMGLFSYDPTDLYNKKFYVEAPDDFHFYYTGPSIQAAVFNREPGLFKSPELLSRYNERPTFTNCIFRYHGDFVINAIHITEREKNIFGEPSTAILSQETISALGDASIQTGNIFIDTIQKYLHDDVKLIGKTLSEYKGKYTIRPSLEDMVIVSLFLYSLLEYRKYLSRKESEIHG